jgi:hypothetical protein
VGVLLSYLVTSRARRELLVLLWRAGAEGSVSALARRAGVSFAAAHRELVAMRSAGLARSKRQGAAAVYSANPASAHAALLHELAREAAVLPQPAADTDELRTWLSAAGAPLLVARPAKGPGPSLEEVLAEGVALAHRDAGVARVLPLVLWRHRDTLDYDELVRQATLRNEDQALGFFLELTGKLGNERKLLARARSLRDGRRTRTRPFFARPLGRRELALARARTPALARRWGFVMNMDLESFASTFAKHRGAA